MLGHCSCTFSGNFGVCDDAVVCLFEKLSSVTGNRTLQKMHLSVLLSAALCTGACDVGSIPLFIKSHMNPSMSGLVIVIPTLQNYNWLQHLRPICHLDKYDMPFGQTNIACVVKL